MSKKVKMTVEQTNFLKEVDKLLTILGEVKNYWEDEDFAFNFPNKQCYDDYTYQYGEIHIWDTVCPKSLEDDDERPCPVSHIYIKEDEYEENGYSFCYYINDTVQYTDGYHLPCGISKFTKTMLKEMLVELNRFARKQYKEYKEQYA